ncbi:hypothetical protein PBNK65E_000134900 [Plasmodium berghei]|uniref:Uncharacterized protein n=1 Tax=Plasmodium berghei TaxID=5821 RepID=A0A0Y9VTW1_PLABE|nr:hypothetical protein PBK173_000141400 [Plasmodium berghei]SCM20574.1 hypothetical protein PBNK65NY_000134300 [Plasmodium berghei]SCN24168.1 hypothetical protein PBNK65E_000134900 [Plasmodium berghei]SCO59429.1 hypothetical protein PBSP11RLL_000134300 [Plasmodium berghei]SCO60666.1 hypothetical protein PBSP11A_000134300 [Plasmodium berghei]
MEDQRMCELFLEAGNFFNGKNVKVKKMNESPAYKQYFPNNKPCSNNRESIGALIEYLFTYLYNNESNYYEHFMM